jgi:hypothetical protein
MASEPNRGDAAMAIVFSGSHAAECRSPELTNIEIGRDRHFGGLFLSKLNLAAGNQRADLPYRWPWLF